MIELSRTYTPELSDFKVSFQPVDAFAQTWHVQEAKVMSYDHARSTVAVEWTERTLRLGRVLGVMSSNGPAPSSTDKPCCRGR